jgi:threonine aldolase
MKPIDLRSDTVTKPSVEMLNEIVNAPVGDDVFGEDPTVNDLQRTVADMFGKEAGLFVPSGVMGNQLAIKVHTESGDEVLVERESHIFHYETTAPSLLSGIQLYTLSGRNGVIDTDEFLNALRPPAYYMPRSRLLCLENTHNRYGGSVYPLHDLREITGWAREKGLKVHLDGARIWNASVSSGVAFTEYGMTADTISVCFSKGLGAPVGSMLLGNTADIERARRFRKIFGGGMRQAGILAAACKYAIRNNIQRLQIDHSNAEKFRSILSDIDGLRLFPEGETTNMCIIDVAQRLTGPIDEILQDLREEGILLTSSGRNKIRAVTHLDVRTEEVISAAEILRNYILAH